MTRRLLAACCIICLTGAPAAHAEDTQNKALVLDLTCTIPADGPEVEDGALVARLYEYDPMLADASAAEIARATIFGLTHKPGRNTILRIPLRGMRVERKQYYVSAFVYPDISSNERLYFIDGFQAVFENTAEQTLNIILAPVRRER